jgi:poly-gamma-glutamate capsule biosynthesis protein CapA/YwtB (metallophosphatase superfamily)
MRSRLSLFIALIISLSGCSIFSHNEETPPVPPVVKEEPKPEPVAVKEIAYNPVKEDSIVHVSLSLVGDLMTHLPQVNNARLADGSFDFNPSFEYVKPYLSSADFTIGNLETTCAGPKRPYSGYPAFNTPDAFVTALKNTGFDLLVTSNNHSMDTEEEGLLRTIDVITQNGLSYTGTHKTQRDRDSVRIYNLKGLTLAVLNYTYGTNGILPRPDHKYMLNVIDTLLIQNDIANARKAGAELVLVFFHYGQENIAEPNTDQRFIVNKTILYGADLIIGAHPHVIGPVDYYKTVNAAIDTGFVAYSLGNFISNQYWRYTDAGLILNIRLQKNFTKNKTRVSDVSYIPTWVYRSTSPLRKGHTVIPSELSLNDSIAPFIDGESKKKMKQAFSDTDSILKKYTKKILRKSRAAEAG